jgi:hypothetical protein
MGGFRNEVGQADKVGEQLKDNIETDLYTINDIAITSQLD